MRRISQNLIFAALAILAIPVMANTFKEDLKQVDNALKNNPSGALRQSLESCLKSRNHAVVLNKMGMGERARHLSQALHGGNGEGSNDGLALVFSPSTINI
jgi:hypothetical protein